MKIKTLYLVLGCASACVGVQAQAASGTAQLSRDAYYVSEDAGSVSISVERLGGTDGVLSVDYVLRAATATANVDFTEVTGTLNFVDGDAVAKTVAIPVQGDLLDESDETFRVVLSTVDATMLGFPSQAWVTIVDHEDGEPGAIRFENPDSLATEGDASVPVRLIRTGGSAGSIAVSVVRVGGSALVNEDFLQSVSTVTFGDREVVKTMTLTLIIDGDSEGLEDALFELQSTTTARHAPTQHVLYINDLDDGSSPTFSFSQAERSVSEDFGHVAMDVERRGGVSINASVPYSVAGGSAVSGADFEVVGTQRMFAGGQSSDGITVRLLGDSTSEGLETLLLALGSPSVGSLGDTAQATINIIDHESGGTGQLSFESALLSHPEDGGFALIRVQRRSGSFGSVSANYSVIAGTASAANDFTVVSGTLVFGDAEVEKVFSVPVFNDDLVEGDETIALSLTGSAIGPVSSATLILADDERPGTLRFSQTELSVPEHVGFVTVTVERIDGADGEVSARIRTSDVTATAAQDYVQLDQLLTFLPGETTRSVQLEILDDFIPEGVESFTIALSEENGGVQIGSPDSISVSIAGGEPGVLTFAETAVSVREDAGEVMLELLRTGGTDGKFRSRSFASQAPPSTERHNGHLKHRHLHRGRNTRCLRGLGDI
ncbi:MAG: Calx-beta domain-containing protein [Myxococcota bacterium]